HGIDSAEQKRCQPVPPASEESPEVSEASAHPAIETAFDRHGGSEFGGNQTNRDRPEEGNDEQIDQGHTRAGGGNHVLQAKRATGAVGEHYPDEVEERGFVEGTFCRSGSGLRHQWSLCAKSQVTSSGSAYAMSQELWPTPGYSV